MPHIWAGQVLLPMVVKHNSAPLVAPWLPVLMFLLLLASASANHDRPPQKDFKASFRRLRYKRENSHPMWTARPDLLEGDIILENTGSLRASVNQKIYLWPEGIVPYVFDSSLSFDARTAINSAIKTMKSLSCVRFKSRTNEQHYVKFISGNGCYSSIGRVRKREGQDVSIGQGCEREGVVLHELMHTLGFFHTNSRPDRDAYVIVYAQNVRPGFKRNFMKYSHGEVDRLRAPYDVTSIMHLPQKSWSRNGLNTIESRAGSQVVLGQRIELSVVDRQQLNQLYKCSSNHGCYLAMGFEKGQIADSQLTASSYKKYYQPPQARLHLTAGSKGNGAWCAKQSFRGEYLQVDLGSIHKITAIATQGMTGLFVNAWVFGYKLQGSNSARAYSWVTHVQFLRGNWDANSVQYNALKTPFRARYVRIVPTYWYNEICLRVELYGCKLFQG